MVEKLDLTRVATELYQELPADFTAARNARAKQIASRGDRSLANDIRRLPKTSASVWALNHLAIQDSQAADGFRALGAELRDAQQQADRDRLDRLVTQRKILIAKTMKAMHKVCEGAGVQLSSSAKEEIEQSLQAALADEAAASAVFSGRLVNAIQSDGLDPVDLSGAVVGKLPLASAHRSSAARQSTTHPKVAPKPDTALIERTGRAAEKAALAVEHLRRLKTEIDKERDELELDAELLQEQFAALRKRREDLDDRSVRIEQDTRKAIDASRDARRVADEAKRSS
jgi:hypothetical protein